MPSCLPTRTLVGAALCLLVIQLNSRDSFASHDDLHKERTHDGGVSPDHGDEDHKLFEHSSILGSRKEAEEFEDLSPEEAKKRLRGISKLMDSNKDGSIDKDELKKWILNSFESLAREEATERFEDTDANRDKLVSWAEHVSETFGDGSVTHDNEQEKKEHETLLAEERELFLAADKDKDGLLTMEEYAKLSQPQEYPEMHKIIVTHALKKKDVDGDGKISMEEFLKEEGLSKEHLLAERERFQYDLDRNKDGVLDFDEFYSWVIPDNNQIAEQEVEHLMESSDDNRDGKLSIDEVVDHHEVFVGSEATDYGEHLIKYKDEL